MPHYKTNERDENNQAVYKDVCNPITAEFRKELYETILDEYEKMEKSMESKDEERKENVGEPKFSVSVTPFEREGSNIRGLARIYFDDCFIVNNVNVLQGRDKLFVAMPSYKTKQVDEQDKAIYQDVCYPVTKEFREKLYNTILSEYEKELEKQQSQDNRNDNRSNKTENTSRNNVEFMRIEEENTPFR